MLEFKSATGNMYAWDEDVGLFIPFSQTMKVVATEISHKKSRENIIEKLRDNFNEDEIAFCYDWLQKWNKIKHQKNKLIRERSYEDARNSSFKIYLLKYGFKQLTLNVTDNCNLRCKYCGYSDYYKYSRGYPNKYMSFAVAKKAIDYYFSLFEEGRRYNPKRKPSVAFYGGEPLLNFSLIKDCIKYINEIYNSFDTSYNITTNGTLLDKYKANWLMRNNVAIAVSLDGPEMEHDRNRVYKNGEGSFKDTMKNLSKVMDSNYEKFSAISVFDWMSDLFKRDEFFKKSEVPLLSFISAVNSGPGCTYYDQFSEKDCLAFREQVRKARTNYLDKLKDRRKRKEKQSVFDLLFGITAYSTVDRCITVFSSTRSLMPFTGACIPGEKIFVDVDGKFHICERVNGTYPIGDIEVGLDFGKIKEIVLEYLRHMDKCDSCKLKRSCDKCFGHFMADKRFLYSSEVCKDDESSQAYIFGTAFSIAEIDPSFMKHDSKEE